MRNHMLNKLVILVISIFIIESPGMVLSQESDTCYNSFVDFAYRAPLMERERMAQSFLPAWTATANIPDTEKLLAKQFIHPVLARQYQEQTQLWLRHFASFQAPDSSEGFLIYTVESQSWEFIQTQIGDSAVFVDQLYITDDNRVWGRTNWDTSQENSSLPYVPVLAVFNDSTRRFQFATNAPEVPFKRNNVVRNPVELVLDQQGILWGFNIDHSIYQYVPATEVSKRVVDLPGELIFPYSVVVSTALAADGSIYFETFSTPLSQPNFRVKRNTLYHFFPQTYTIETLSLPVEEWPIFLGLRVDRENRLWLGSTGYRTENGEWQLLHSSPADYFDVVDNGGISEVWAPARLIHESSDGRLWFNRFQDTGGWVDGLAWYNPKTGEGCQVTNEFTTLIEDDQRRLWTVAEGTLYYEITTK